MITPGILASIFSLCLRREIPKLAAAERVEPSMCRLSPRKVDKALLLLQVASLLAVLSSARATDYYVDPSDENAYATVQAAVNDVAGQSEFNRANIFIAPGTYREIVTIDKPFI